MASKLLGISGSYFLAHSSDRIMCTSKQQCKENCDVMQCTIMITVGSLDLLSKIILRMHNINNDYTSNDKDSVIAKKKRLHVS